MSDAFAFGPQVHCGLEAQKGRVAPAQAELEAGGVFGTEWRGGIVLLWTVT